MKIWSGSMRDASLKACKPGLEEGGWLVLQFMQRKAAPRGQLIIGKLQLWRAATKASM